MASSSHAVGALDPVKLRVIFASMSYIGLFRYFVIVPPKSDWRPFCVMKKRDAHEDPWS
jgi:hypothetical protein